MLKTFTYTKIKQCYICNSKKLEKISNIYSSSIPNFKSYLFLCKSCGYGFLNPQPDNRSYKKINEIWYKKKFSINQKHNEPKILNRHKKTLHRLNKLKILIKPQTKILDIGAGYGQLFDEIKKVYKKTNYYALEQFQEAIDVIKNKGGKIINHQIDEPWSSKYKNFFDLIIFRHTLEHLKDINLCLNQIKNSLSKNGLAYIVVPNSLNDKLKFLKTDFCRPVHLSYFNFFSLSELLKINNFEIYYYNIEKNEICLVVKNSENAKKQINLNQGKKNYFIQKEIYNKKIKEYFYLEFWKIFKIYFKRILFHLKLMN